MKFLIFHISTNAMEMGAGDVMENHKPNNDPNMGVGCAYAGIGVLVFES